MAGPRHLWSGDWERESTTADDLARRQQPTPEAPEPEPEPQRRPRFSTRQLGLGAVCLLVIAGVAVALATTLSGSTPASKHGGARKPSTQRQQSPTGGFAPTQSNPTQSTPSQSQVPSTSAPSKIVAGPSADWLGMQIITSPLGAVVSTVPNASLGNTMGFEPGDVISAIGTHQISTVKQMGSALASVPLGHQVQVTISRGTTILTTAVTVKERPTIKP